MLQYTTQCHPVSGEYMYICMYVHMYVYVSMYICIYARVNMYYVCIYVVFKGGYLLEELSESKGNPLAIAAWMASDKTLSRCTYIHTYIHTLKIVCTQYIIKTKYILCMYVCWYISSDVLEQIHILFMYACLDVCIDLRMCVCMYVCMYLGDKRSD